MMKPEDVITPCVDVDGLWFKREDNYAPFGRDSVNGGKLRQCFKLVESIKDSYDGVISCCSVHSPQAPITAAVAKHFGMECVIFYGGTNKDRLKDLSMPMIALEYGAKINIVARTGRHNVLYSKATEYATKNRFFVVEYGFNITQNPELMLGAVSRQVQNIPDEIDNLIVTCGSGITTIGILMGLQQYHKKVNKVHIVATAPDRTEKIKRYAERELVVHDLFHREGFVYEKGVNATYKGIKLHPQYEAKSFSWLYHNSGIDIHNGKNLFWIVGAEPELRKRARN